MPDEEVHSLSIETTAYYAVQEPERVPDSPPALLLALHGWGQNCRSFLRAFAPLRKHNLIVVAPQAPHQFYLDAGTKKVGFHWITLYDRKQSIQDVNGYIARLLEKLRGELLYDPERVVVLGFSQGSSMAYRFAISGLLRPVGMISCCSDLPPDVAETLGQVQPFPVLLAHGEEDTMVPETRITEAMEALSAHGFRYEAYRFSGGHQMTPELVEKVGEWTMARQQQKPVEPC